MDHSHKKRGDGHPRQDRKRIPFRCSSPPSHNRSQLFVVCYGGAGRDKNKNALFSKTENRNQESHHQHLHANSTINFLFAIKFATRERKKVTRQTPSAAVSTSTTFDTRYGDGTERISHDPNTTRRRSKLKLMDRRTVAKKKTKARTFARAAR